MSVEKDHKENVYKYARYQTVQMMFCVFTNSTVTTGPTAFCQII